MGSKLLETPCGIEKFQTCSFEFTSDNSLVDKNGISRDWGKMYSHLTIAKTTTSRFMVKIFPIFKYLQYLPKLIGHYEKAHRKSFKNALLPKVLKLQLFDEEFNEI